MKDLTALLDGRRRAINTLERPLKDPSQPVELGGSEERIQGDGISTFEEIDAIEHLIELGEDKGYILIDDILAVIPQAEENLDLLEDVYTALLSAGIPYSDNGYLKYCGLLSTAHPESDRNHRHQEGQIHGDVKSAQFHSAGS